MEKTKVLISNKRQKEKKWIWNKKKLKKVQWFKYSGFMFSSKGDYGAYIKELTKKRRIATNMVWDLGERICKDG